MTNTHEHTMDTVGRSRALLALAVGETTSAVIHGSPSLPPYRMRLSGSTSPVDTCLANSRKNLTHHHPTNQHTTNRPEAAAEEA